MSSLGLSHACADHGAGLRERQHSQGSRASALPPALPLAKRSLQPTPDPPAPWSSCQTRSTTCARRRRRVRRWLIARCVTGGRCAMREHAMHARVVHVRILVKLIDLVLAGMPSRSVFRHRRGAPELCDARGAPRKPAGSLRARLAGGALSVASPNNVTTSTSPQLNNWSLTRLCPGVWNYSSRPYVECSTTLCLSTSHSLQATLLVYT